VRRVPAPRRSQLVLVAGDDCRIGRKRSRLAETLQGERSRLVAGAHQYEAVVAGPGESLCEWTVEHFHGPYGAGLDRGTGAVCRLALA
jgi:hypothetical protein